MTQRKKICVFAWVAIMVLASQTTVAQTGTMFDCPANYNEVNYGMTTDYTAPALAGTQQVGTVTQFPHKTNWFRWDTPQGLDNSHWWWGKGLLVDNILSPWYDEFDFPNRMKEHGEYKPEHGWELVVENLGINYNGGGSPLYKSDVVYPLVVLYNKYRSILRVFWSIPDNQNPNLARFTLTVLGNELQANSSRIPNLVHTSTYDAPLIALDRLPFAYVPMPNNQLKKENPQLEVVRDYPQTMFPNNSVDTKWMYADYYIQYDPCVCMYPSSMQLQVSLIDEVLIETTAITNGEIVSKQGSSMSAVPDAGNHFVGLGDFAKGGLKVMKSAGSNVSGEVGLSAKDKLDKGEITLEQYSAALAAGTGLEDFVNGLKDFGNFLKTAKPYVSFALDMIDIISGGGSKGPTAVSIMPMTMWSETKTNGKMTSIDPKPAVRFNTPGSLLSTTVNNPQQNNAIPYYNHPLGVFNLVRTPKVQVMKEQKHINCQEDGQVDWIAFPLLYQSKCIFNWDDDIRHKIKLQDDIEYVLNPAAGLDVEEIYAAVEVDYDGKWRHIPNAGWGVRDTEIQQTDTMTVRKSISSWRTQFVPLGCLKDVYIDIHGINRGRTAELRSGMGTNACNMYDCDDVEYSSTITPRYHEIKGVFVKLIVNLKPKDPNRKNVVLTLRYPTTIEELEANQQNQQLFQSSWTGVPTNKVFEKGNPVQSFAVWETIQVNDDAQPVAGSIELVAGKEIIISRKADITFTPEYGDIILRLGDPVECNTFINPKDAGFVNAFCQDTSVNAYEPEERIPALKIEQTFVEDEPVRGYDIVQTKPVLYDAYPNPFGNYTVLRYSIGQPGKVELFVTDALGQRVATLVDSQQGRGTFDVSFVGNDIPAGVYYYTLRTDTFIQTKKVVLMR